MKYELALKLKKSGFPYGTKHDRDGYRNCGTYGCFWKDDEYTIHKRGYSEDACNPTLSELIEACGNYVFLLQLEDGWGATKSPNGFKDIFILGEHKSGDTPEIAVANLWLELNKK